MKRWQDPFPGTPKGFHDRVEQTLGGLEDMDMRSNHRYRKLNTVLAAALIAILASSAVAMVLGNARFRKTLTDGGADEVAALVQEVHMPAAEDEADGFALSIDEIIWEDDKLYFSYTASVPEDGNRYLLALYTPLLNGEPMAFYATDWENSCFFDDRIQCAIPMGSGLSAECGQLLTFRVNPALRQKAANALLLRADFFKADLDLTGEVSGFETRFKGAVPTVCLTFDKSESLEAYSERLELPSAETAALRAIADAAGGDGILTPEELADTAHVEYVARRETRMALDASKLMQTVYDGVEETEFEVNGCKVTVEDFHMTHLGASFKLRVTAPAGLSEAEGKRLIDDIIMPKQDGEGDDYTWSLFRPDGSELALDQGWEGGAGYQPLPDGTASYGLSYDINGIIPLEGLEKVVLMPYNIHYDDHDRSVYNYLKEWAVELTPVQSWVQTDITPLRTLTPDEQTAFDRAMNGEVTTRLERRTAVANWREGDPTVTVYAAEEGALYHVDIDCSGMSSAFPRAIEDAVRDGKRPCPDCIGGTHAPEEVDVFTGTYRLPDDG